MVPKIPTQQKPPLSHEELTDIIDLSLWAGQMLLQYGAETKRIEETIHHIGTGLGCNWLDIIVSADGLTVTATSGDEFRTKVRRVTRLGVNFAIIDRINDISRQVYAGELDPIRLRPALTEISTMPPEYNRWIVVSMVALACGAFSMLFGADWPVFVITCLAAGAAMFIRQELTRQHLNLFLTVSITAFIAGIIASLGSIWNIGTRPELALAASVLLLVPGVPLINAAEDLLQGYVISGTARGITGGIITLCIAAGLTIAQILMGVEGL